MWNKSNFAVYELASVLFIFLWISSAQTELIGTAGNGTERGGTDWNTISVYCDGENILYCCYVVMSEEDAAPYFMEHDLNLHTYNKGNNVGYNCAEYTAGQLGTCDEAIVCCKGPTMNFSNHEFGFLLNCVK